MNYSKEQITVPPRSDGFTLVEVMVAVLVLSIGLLGIASLQATSLRNNNDASMQTRASYIVSDMADRMRANTSQAGNYAGNYMAADPSPVNVSCQSGSCTPTGILQKDVAQWNTQLQSLPAGQGTVTALAGSLYAITVRWDEARTGATGTGCDIDDPNDLRCLSITTQP